MNEIVKIDNRNSKKKKEKELELIEARDYLRIEKLKEDNEKKQIAEIQRLEDLKKYHQDIAEKRKKKQEEKEIMRIEQLKAINNKLIQIKEEKYHFLLISFVILSNSSLKIRNDDETCVHKSIETLAIMEDNDIKHLENIRSKMDQKTIQMLKV